MKDGFWEGFLIAIATIAVVAALAMIVHLTMESADAALECAKINAVAVAKAGNGFICVEGFTP